MINNHLTIKPGGLIMGTYVRYYTLLFVTSIFLTTVNTNSILAGQANFQNNPDNQKPPTAKDYGKWESVGRGGSLSPDGKWLIYSIRRNNGNNELRLHNLKDESKKILIQGSGQKFSDNSEWLGYLIGVTVEESKKLRKQNKPVRNRFALLNLVKDDSLIFKDVVSFSFSANSQFVAMKRYLPKGKKSKGTDLVIHNLITGTDFSFGNISEYRWQDEGTLLALLIDADAKAGNAVQLFNAATGEIKILDSKDVIYKGLVWRKKSDDLAVFRTENNENYEDSTNLILSWKGLSSKTTKFQCFDQNTISDFPDDTRILNSSGLQWSKNGESLFFNIIEWNLKPSDKKAKTDSTKTENPDSVKTENPPSLQIWHSKDVRIIPEQQQLAERGREDTFLAVWHIKNKEFVQLGNKLTENVRIQADVDLSLGIDASPYEFSAMFGRPTYDLYSIDNQTGNRSIISKDVYYINSISPDGKNLIYVKDDHYFIYNFKSGEQQNLTSNIGLSFVNNEDDHPIFKFRPYGFGGWSEDSKSFFLNSKYDVWQFWTDGSPGKKITDGEDDKVIHRMVRLDRDEKYIDSKAPMYFSLYGEWTKNYGYASGIPGKDIKKLVWEEANVSGLIKAKNVDVFVFNMQDFDDSPDFFVTQENFKNIKQVSNTNPFQKDYVWGKSELIEYFNHNGKKLQGALFYPADYEPGKKYPMITYIYEITSTSARRYQVPSEKSYYNTSVFTHQGYFVLQPDIVFDIGDPGISSVRTMEAAVKKVVDMGLVDKDRVGLVGHSWGGYQSAYAVTQTDIFAAAVAGAGLTDFFSMYGMVAWDFGGTPETFHFEVSQERMKVPPWEDIEGFVRNSPVLHVHKVNTPIMFEVGDNDKNVDWRQGIEYYNTMRRAGKQMVLLVYAKEGHGLRQDHNRIDYQRRILQWFAHYLKDEPAKEWISGGIPYVEQIKKLENWKK